MHYTGKRTVVLWGDNVTVYETNRIIKEFSGHLADNRDEWITFMIYSSGGLCTAGFALYDWLLANVPNLQTVALGEVNSMAVILFLTGKHRVVARNCTFFLHPVANSYQKETTLDSKDHINAIKGLEKTQKQYIDTLSERLEADVPVKKLKKAIKKTATLSSKKVIKWGIAHEMMSDVAIQIPAKEETVVDAD